MNRMTITSVVAILFCIAGWCWGAEPRPNYEHLNFFEGYVGTWSISATLEEDTPFGKKGDVGSASITWKWDYSKNVVDWRWKFDFSGKWSGTKGTMTWDPIQKKAVGAGVSSDGGIIRVTERSTNPLTFYVEFVGPDGKKSSQVETFTLVDNDTMTIKTTDRIGLPAPGDSPKFTFKRVGNGKVK